MRFFLPLLLMLPASAWAKAFERPIPNAQSATAEHWFAAASVLLVLALAATALLVSRR